MTHEEVVGEVIRRTAVGLGRQHFRDDRNRKWRGWLATLPEIYNEYRVTWEGCLHICTLTLDNNLGLEKAPDGLFLRSVPNVRDAPYLDEGSEVIVLDSDGYFADCCVPKGDWNKLPLEWRKDLLANHPFDARGRCTAILKPYAWHRQHTDEQRAA